MNDRPYLDRILESYALDDLEPHTRRLAEDALAGRHETITAEEAKEALRFERVLVEGFESEARDDVADRVLDRLYRRPEIGARRDFRPSLAQDIVGEAQSGGQMKSRPQRRRYYFERPGFVRAAGFLFVLGGLMFMSLRDFWRTSAQETPEYQIQAPSVEPIANLAFVSDTSARPERVKAPPTMDAIYAGATIETREDQRAFIKLPGAAGRIVVHPASRVRLVRQLGTKQLRLFIEEGGVWADLPGHQPLQVQAGPRYGGQLRGRGEVMLAARSMGGARHAGTVGVGRSLVVSMGEKGRAVFRNGAEEIALRGNETGVVGETAAVKMPRGASTPARVPLRTWPLGDAVEDGQAEAIRIGPKVFDREAVIHEALRVYGPDFVDLQVRSLVIGAELRLRGLKVTPALRALARRHVVQDEFKQVAPLRSSNALEERIYQTSGLLALAYGGSIPAGDVSSSLCNSTWAKLVPHVAVTWPKSPRSAFAIQVRFRGQELAVLDLATAWSSLRTLLRPTEVERLMDDMVETWVIRTWLESQGGTWSEPRWSKSADPAQRSAQELLVRMSGMTPAQFVDRSATRRVVLAYEPAPPRGEVERFISDELPGAERVAFEHFVFPFEILGEGAEGERLARRRAENAVATLRSAIAGYPAPIKGADELPSVWRTGPRVGPRPWWDEIYGEGFGRRVMRLEEGEVSEVIRGREAFHVVRMKRIVPSAESPQMQRERARQMLTVDTARARVQRLLDRVAMDRVSGRDLLR